jgi:hypothetical protein
MIKGISFPHASLAWAFVLGVGLVVMGCEGESKPLPSKSEEPPKQAPQPSPKVLQRRAGPGGRLAEGGDMSAQEKRAARLRAKAQENQQP